MKSIQSKFAKAKAQGFLRTLEVQFNRFVPPWVFRYSKGDIYDFDIESLKSLRPEGGISDDLIVRCLDESASEEDRIALREFTWNSVPLETTTNDIGYAIYDANEPSKLLAGVWAAKESFLENNLGVQFTFAEQQSWLYCAFVHADARGRGVYKSLISFAATDLQERGFTQLLGIVQPWNRISRIMHEKQSRLVTNPTKAPATVSILKECWKPTQPRTKPVRNVAIGKSKMPKPL